MVLVNAATGRSRIRSPAGRPAAGCLSPPLTVPRWTRATWCPWERNEKQLLRNLVIHGFLTFPYIHGGFSHSATQHPWVQRCFHQFKTDILKPEKLQFTKYLELLFKEKRLQRPICTGCYGNNKGIYVGWWCSLKHRKLDKLELCLLQCFCPQRVGHHSAQHESCSDTLSQPGLLQLLYTQLPIKSSLSLV